MGLSLVSVFILAGSMSTSQIVASQQQLWWALPLLPAFVIYVISMIGETNRLPFDLPEAEGELVSGYMTEYSSMKFAWFFLAEYINMINVSAVATTLFLGGWRAPWPLSAIGDGVLNTGWWPVLWFLAKMWLFMFLFVWVRGTLLRLRYDQFMKLGWKVLIPVALAWVVMVAVVQGIRQFTDGRPAHAADRARRRRSLVFLGISFLVPQKPEPAGDGRAAGETSTPSRAATRCRRCPARRSCPARRPGSPAPPPARRRRRHHRPDRRPTRRRSHRPAPTTDRPDRARHGGAAWLTPASRSSWPAGRAGTSRPAPAAARSARPPRSWPYTPMIEPKTGLKRCSRRSRGSA